MNYIPPRRSDGTIQHARLKSHGRRAPIPHPVDRRCGIRGVFPAAVLAELESRFLGGASITNHLT